MRDCEKLLTASTPFERWNLEEEEGKQQSIERAPTRIDTHEILKGNMPELLPLLLIAREVWHIL